MRALLVLLVLLAGCSEPAPDAEPPWHGRDTSEPGWNPMPLASCLILEFDFFPNGAPRDLQWDWFVAERVAIEFQVHAHEGDGVRFVHASLGDEDQGNYLAPAEGAYSFTWTHRGSDDLTMWVKTTPPDNRVGYSLQPNECT